MLVLIKST